MGDANRRVRVFPNQRFDAWRGDWRAIANRLLEVIAFVPDGPAAYYRDIAKVVVQLACNHPDGPPSSSGELLHRLDHEHLLNAHGPVDALLSLPRERVAQVRMRYQAFFGQLGSLFDGDWSFDDTDAAYFLLDSVALGEDTASAASLLFADFAHYFTARKHPERRCLLLLDEFAALAGSSDLASKVEQARSFNTALVLIPQTVAGLGDRSQRDRVLGSVDLVISHAVNEPDRLAQLAGVRRVLELTHRLEDGARVAATARLEPQPRLDPDQIRTLPVGTAWAICRGQAAKLSVRRAPTGPPAMLPRAQPIDAAPEPSTVTIPRRTSYLGEEA
jgi:hypothetical protein